LRFSKALKRMTFWVHIGSNGSFDTFFKCASPNTRTVYHFCWDASHMKGKHHPDIWEMFPDISYRPTLEAWSSMGHVDAHWFDNTFACAETGQGNLAWTHAAWIVNSLLVIGWTRAAGVNYLQWQTVNADKLWKWWSRNIGNNSSVGVHGRQAARWVSCVSVGACVHSSTRRPPRREVVPPPPSPTRRCQWIIRTPCMPRVTIAAWRHRDVMPRIPRVAATVQRLWHISHRRCVYQNELTMQCE